MQWMFAAILMTSGNMILTSCSDDDHTSSDNGGTEYTIEEPATDQMGIRVTANLPAASLSQFDEKSTGAALIKRLPRVTSAIQGRYQVRVGQGQRCRQSVGCCD